MLILFLSGGYAQKEIKLSADIQKATIYLNSAQLFHKASVSLPKGQSEVVFEGVAASLDMQSLQAGGKGNFTILDISFRTFYPEPKEQKMPDAYQRKIDAVGDSILDISFIHKHLLARREVLQLEKTLLYNNKLVKGEGKSDSLELLANTITYYDEALDRVLKELIDLERKEVSVLEEKSRLEQRLIELNNHYLQNHPQEPMLPVPQVIVSVVTEYAVSATIEFNYLTYNAGWYATYDLKATDIGKPVNLTYKANIWQNTGIDWKNVRLTCSTGNPSVGNNPPSLTTWYLRYYDQMQQERAATITGAQSHVTEDFEMADEVNVYTDQMNAGNASAHTTAQQNVINMEFDINLSYTIPSNGKARIVSLKETTLAADYNYLIIPKLDSDAFLLARITGWEDQGLLPGNANIYFGNSLVARTFFNTTTFTDTLSVSLGRDKGIEVARAMLKDKSSNKVIGSDRKVERVIEIEVRNARSATAEIIVMDQIPVSTDNSIKVNAGDLSGAELNELTGMLTWRKKLKAKDTQKFRFSFDVTYPKDRRIDI